MLLISTFVAIAIFSLSAWRLVALEEKAGFSETLREEICRDYEFRQVLKLLLVFVGISRLLIGAAAFFAIMIGLGYLLEHGPEDGLNLVVFIGGLLGASLCHGLGRTIAQVEIYISLPHAPDTKAQR